MYMASQNNINAVFEGGGVKGIGLVGAVAATERLGYSFAHVAGTSAGAIVAACIAAGYTAIEMEEILKSIDYLKFKDEGVEDKIPLAGPLVSLLLENGLYEGKYFENWLRDLLLQKNIRTFGDLVMEDCKGDPRHRYRLQVIASDITRGRMLILPNDLAEYDIDPDSTDVAWAVRMSMSIPFFYEPVLLRNKKREVFYIVDGGILSNFPVWIYDDDKSHCTFPTFGYKLVEPEEGKPREISGPVSLLKALFATMVEAHDARYIKDRNFMRTVPIPTLGIQTTQFEMSPEQSEQLYQSGYRAGEEFFQQWNLTQYQSRLKEAQKISRTKRIWNM